MNLISVRNLGKAYYGYRHEALRFLSWLGFARRPCDEYWVLRHVNFDIYAGEAVGVIGQNGAGKSTLLKMIAGTLQPTEGNIQVNGRVAAILELGMGFNPELTGRQNVYYSAGLMGFTSEQINMAMPEIEEFAEIGDFFDKPVRMYSSGMQMRLAFAVTTAYRPEILIIDEALSVGDSYFQHKSFNRIREFQKQGTTFLIVSHDVGVVKFMCDKVLMLEKGTVIKEGTPGEVVDFYNALIAKKESTTIVQEKIGSRIKTTSGTGKVTFSEIQLYNENAELVSKVKVGEVVELRLTVVVNQSVDSLVLGCGITDRLGQMMFGTNTWKTKQILENLKKGEVYLYKVSFSANLGVGSYAVTCALTENESHVDENFEWRDNTLVFDVVNVDKEFFVGCMWNKMNFSIEKLKKDCLAL